MKYLLLVAIVAVAYMVWRHGRLTGPGPAARKPPGPPDPPQDMVSCPVCAVHLPRAEAVTGANGLLYCSQEHRLKAGS